MVLALRLMIGAKSAFGGNVRTIRLADHHREPIRHRFAFYLALGYNDE